MYEQIPIELGATAFAIGTFFLLIKELLKFIRNKDKENKEERNSLFAEFIKTSASFKQTIDNHLKHEEVAHTKQSESNKKLTKAIAELLTFLKKQNGNSK